VIAVEMTVTATQGTIAATETEIVTGTGSATAMTTDRAVTGRVTAAAPDRQT